MTKAAAILLVEDNPMDVELIIDAFKEARLGNKIQVPGMEKKRLNFYSAMENMRIAKNTPYRILSCWTSRCRGLTAMRY